MKKKTVKIVTWVILLIMVLGLLISTFGYLF